MTNIGFARDLIVGDSLQSQVTQLKQFGCQMIYKQKRLQTKIDLFDAINNSLNPKDVFIVVNLTCLGCNLRELLNLFKLFDEKDCDFVSLRDGIDTRELSISQLIMMTQSLSTMETQVSLEKTHRGLDLARQMGRVGGRPEIHADNIKEQAYQLYLKKKLPISIIVKDFGMSRATFYRYIEKKKLASN